MRKYLFCVLTLITLGYNHRLYAQQANPTHIGAVKGVLRDTAHNYFLKSSTVSLFKADSTLLSYQLSNNYGEFIFKNLPLNAKMYIEVSHVGYQLFRKSFIITDGKIPLDLKTLVIATKDITLKEVEIKVPPVTMNGDTLEFNAAAFKLDSNAVVEDLLRKIPNITLWGDGQITVNGREVKTLLVNGKPFFGGDFKTATQNISKNALEKIQVYKAVEDRNNPLDSTVAVNLKLKKGKELGYFGKIGGGYGTRDRYESDVSINAFSPKMQAAVIGASNNINKVANSVRTLTANSTFKGVGTNIDYQPDFRTAGINKTHTGGMNFTYNFVEKPDYSNKNSLTTNYFVQRKIFGNVAENETITTIDAANKVSDRNVSDSRNETDNQNFDASYEYAKKEHRLSLKQSFSITDGENNNTQFRRSFDEQGRLTSTNRSTNTSNNDSKRFSLTGRYNYYPQSSYSKKKTFGGVSVDYSLNVNDNQTERYSVTEFRSMTNPATNRDVNRRYMTDGSTFTQRIFTELPNLRSWILGNRNRFWNLDLRFTNEFNNATTKSDNVVADLNTTTNTYVANAYLTNALTTHLIDDNFGLALSKNFHKSLSNRFYKSATITLAAKQRLIYQNNISDRSFQNIKRNYSNFVPTASINFNENQYGEFYRNLSFNFTTNIRIPNVNQLAPLVDDANQYSIQYGNLNLKEETERSINVNFNHTTQKSKNNWEFYLWLSHTFTENAFVDSLFIAQDNRRTNYLTNANGARNYNFNTGVKKAYKLKNSELQVEASTSGASGRIPGYLNTVYLFSSTLNTESMLKLYFLYKDKWAIDVQQRFSYYRSKQEAFDTKYDGKTWSSILSTNYNFTKKISLNSNISFNTNQSSNSDNINFNIWNASAIFRFLKGNNVEFKVSALDILRQNNNVINSISLNSFSTGTQTVLQQYFMTTLSYYPRKFGKNGVKK